MKKLTTEEFKKRARKVHGDKYNYDEVEYKRWDIKVKIKCSKHGVFEQRANHHLTGCGCPKCKDKKISESNIKSQAQFIIDAKKVHGSLYNYNLIKYINYKTEVKIICPIHGIFKQKPYIHLRGVGCPSCSREKMSKLYTKSQNQFIKEAKIIHNNKYGYNLVKYKRGDIKVIIICKKHGEFLQSPDSHLQGSGCPKCTHNISKPETLWLNMINILDDKEHRQVSIKINNKIIRTDGYDPKSKTIYLFHGDFWHGNYKNKKFSSNKINDICHKTFGELYKNTKKIERLIRKSGYNLVTIWERDFKILLKKQKKERNNVK